MSAKVSGVWILYAEFLLWAAEKVRIPEAPWLILGEPDPNDLASFLEKSPYSEAILNEGVLFVAQVYQHSTAMGYVHGLSIEGIGSTPEDAALNFLVGADQSEIRSLAREVDQFFVENFPEANLIEYTRLPNRDIGFFIKRGPDGKFYAGADWLEIDMRSMRQRAAIKYASLSYASNRVFHDNLVQLRATQISYTQILDEFIDRFQRRELSGRLSDALRLRDEAINNLERAQNYYEKAAKWARVAQGISYLTSVLSLAGAAYGFFSPASGGEKVSAAAQQENEAYELWGESRSIFVEVEGRLLERTLDVRETIREVLPNAPLPPLTQPPTVPNEPPIWLPPLLDQKPVG